LKKNKQKKRISKVYPLNHIQKPHQKYIFFEMPQRIGIATFYVTKALFLKDYP
jgi:hypothetical protein